MRSLTTNSTRLCKEPVGRCTSICNAVRTCTSRGKHWINNTTCHKWAPLCKNIWVRFMPLRFSSHSRLQASAFQSMQGFAQELVDSVLDFLSDDKHALSFCSLVCHSWVGRARLHLFATVGVGQDEKHSLTAFADFLDTTPYFRPVISNLKVEFLQKYRMEESRGRGLRLLPGSQLMINPHDISRVMEKLPGIRTLSFKHALLGTHDPNCSHPSQQFHLDRLTIEDSHSPSPGDINEPVGQNLLDILGLFSQIRELHFHRPAEFVGPLAPHEVVHGGYRVSKFLLSASSLSLSFTRQSDIAIVDVISSALNFSNTTSLTVSCTNEEDMISVANIIRCAGAGLRKFDFNLTQLDFDALLRAFRIYHSCILIGNWR